MGFEPTNRKLKYLNLAPETTPPPCLLDTPVYVDWKHEWFHSKISWLTKMRLRELRTFRIKEEYMLYLINVHEAVNSWIHFSDDMNSQVCVELWLPNRN